MAEDERITCPRCKTEYRLPREHLRSPSVRLRCGQCKHEFSYPPVRRPPRKPAVASPEAEEEANPLFRPDTAGTDSDSAERAEEEESKSDEKAGAAPSVARPQQGERPKRIVASEQRASKKDDEQGEFVLGDEDSEWRMDEEEQPRAPRRPKPQREPVRPPVQREAAKVRAILVFLAAVVAAYGAFALTLVAQPRKAREMVESIPLVGKGLSEERIYRRRVQLSDVSASVQRLRGGHQALVLAGRALNRNPVALREVQIAGKVFNDEGRLVEEKRVFCGNVVTVRMLRDLNAQEISMLQQNAPAHEFVLRPGEAAEFLVVVVDPGGKRLREARLEVVSVRRQA